MANWYRYRQNNSGGDFLIDAKYGIGVVMFIEAHDEDYANSRAQRCGIYFDGVDKGIDCECCGDRWHNYPSKVDQLDGSFGESYAHPLDGKFYEVKVKKDKCR